MFLVPKKVDNTDKKSLQKIVILLQLLLKLKGWDRKLLPKGNHFTIKYFPAGFSFSNGFLMQNQKSFKLDYFLSRLPHFLIHTDTSQASKKNARKKSFFREAKILRETNFSPNAN